MTSKLEDIRARLAAYEAAKEAWGKMPPSLSRVAEECNVDMLYSDLTANAPDDLRALLAVVDASKRFKDVFGESRIDDWSDDFEAAMDAWMAAVDELTKGSE